MRDTLRMKSIFESIKGTTKVKEKQKIISDNSGDDLFVETLMFLCNPLITTGISKSKINKNLNGVTKTTELSEAMNYIMANNTGRDEDIAYVLGFIDTQDAETSDFLKAIFSKDYSIGIGASGINKVINDLIPDFNVMLAEPYSKKEKYIKHIVRLKEKFIILTFKLDGVRVICINDGVNPRFYSREGKPMLGLIELEEEFRKLAPGVYDGELVAKGKFASAKDLYKATMKIKGTKGDKTGLAMYTFDYMQEKEFLSGICEKPCLNRKKELEAIIGRAGDLDSVKYLKPLFVGEYDEEVVSKLHNYAISIGMEGVMINVADAPYEGKRTPNLLKLKEFFTADLRIIGYERSENEYTNTNGKLLVGDPEDEVTEEDKIAKQKEVDYVNEKLKNNELLGAFVLDYKGHKVKVGSGFSVLGRINFWEDRDKYVGKLAEVQYREETSNANGGLSLRFPVFLRFREDKDTPSEA